MLVPLEDGHMPSINLSKPSHCVLPVDRRYRMCCCVGGGGGPSARILDKRSCGMGGDGGRGRQTRSWTWRCLSNSCLAKTLVSSRVF